MSDSQENPLFVTEEVKEYISALYDARENRHKNVSTVAMTYSLYISLGKFMENIAKYDTVDKRNTLKNYLVNIICSDDEFYTTELKTQKIDSFIAHIRKENDSILSGNIFRSDKKENQQILKAMGEIRRKIPEMLNGRSKQDCKTEIMDTLKQYFQTGQNMGPGEMKLHNEIRQTLTNADKSDTELFMKFFNFVKCDSDTNCEKYTVSDEKSTGSRLNLKKEGETIILLELLKGNNTKVVVTTSDSGMISSFFNYIWQNIFGLASIVAVSMIGLYTYDNMNTPVTVSKGGGKYKKSMVGGAMPDPNTLIVMTTIFIGLFYMAMDVGTLLNAVMGGAMTTATLMGIIALYSKLNAAWEGKIEIFEQALEKGAEINPDLKAVGPIDRGVIGNIIKWVSEKFKNFYTLITNTFNAIINKLIEVYDKLIGKKIVVTDNVYEKYGLIKIDLVLKPKDRDNITVFTFGEINKDAVKNSFTKYIGYTKILSEYFKKVTDIVTINIENPLIDFLIPDYPEDDNYKNDYGTITEVINNIYVYKDKKNSDGKECNNLSSENKKLFEEIIILNSDKIELIKKHDEAIRKLEEAKTEDLKKIEYENTILTEVAGFTIEESKIKISDIQKLKTYIDKKPTPPTTTTPSEEITPDETSEFNTKNIQYMKIIDDLTNKEFMDNAAGVEIKAKIEYNKKTLYAKLYAKLYASSSYYFWKTGENVIKIAKNPYVQGAAVVVTTVAVGYNFGWMQGIAAYFSGNSVKGEANRLLGQYELGATNPQGPPPPGQYDLGATNPQGPPQTYNQHSDNFLKLGQPRYVNNMGNSEFQSTSVGEKSWNGFSQAHWQGKHSPNQNYNNSNTSNTGNTSNINILGGAQNVKCYNISNLKQNMLSRLVKFGESESYNYISTVEECDLDELEFGNNAYVIDDSVSIEEKKVKPKGCDAEPEITSKYDKLECLSTTNLARRKKMNNDISKVWNNVNKNLSTPNLLTTPDMFQILKGSNFPCGTNYQLGGGDADETENREFIKTRNQDIRIQYSYQIVSLLKKALQRLNSNGIFLEKKTIEEIQSKINTLKEAEESLAEYAENIVKASKIAVNSKPEKGTMDSASLKEYVNKHKFLSQSADRTAIKLNTVFIKLLELVNDRGDDIVKAIERNIASN
jgi:hypothetical protein